MKFEILSSCIIFNFFRWHFIIKTFFLIITSRVVKVIKKVSVSTLAVKVALYLPLWLSLILLILL
jgi:hypothetical protein